MTSSFTICLPIAVRSVRESMILDKENKQKEAFCQYLSNIVYICGVLKDEAWQRELKECHCPETLKLFKLSSQCLERAQDLLVNSQENTDSSNEQAQSSQLAQTYTPTRNPTHDQVMPVRRTSGTQATLIRKTSQEQPNLGHPLNKQMQVPSPPVSPLNFRKRVQYIDEARRGNTQLLSAYRARMEQREHANRTMRRKTDVTAMNLGLFRKMAENIEIAKARQISLERKNAERQRRLREEADRRMGPSSLLTTHDQIRKEIYVKVLEFEQDSMWLVSLRDQLRAKPEDPTLIQRIINQVLGTSNHPLTKCLCSYQGEVQTQLASITEQAQDILTYISTLGQTSFQEENMTETPNTELDRATSESEISFGEELEEISEYSSGNMNQGNLNSEPCIVGARESSLVFLTEEKEEEYRRILESVVKNVQSSLEILHSLFLLVYEEFSSAAGQDLCLASVEFAFFKPLWPLLLNLYRIVNHRKEARLAKIFVEKASCTPKALNVPDRLCLYSQDYESETSNEFPYKNVVDELQSLIKFESPLEKLECIVRTNRFIVECVEDYYESHGKPRNSPETAIGCDDLLPILSYVIIRSQLPQLVSECNAMEDFISADYLMGEEGYSLTTLQTALAYLETLQERPETQSQEKNAPDEGSAHEKNTSIGDLAQEKNTFLEDSSQEKDTPTEDSSPDK